MMFNNQMMTRKRVVEDGDLRYQEVKMRKNLIRNKTKKKKLMKVMNKIRMMVMNKKRQRLKKNYKRNSS
jgi:hypothetical protein